MLGGGRTCMYFARENELGNVTVRYENTNPQFIVHNEDLTRKRDK